MFDKCQKVCGNCKNCKPFDDKYEYEEDKAGFCKVYGDVVYLDDSACDDFDNIYNKVSD